MVLEIGIYRGSHERNREREREGGGKRRELAFFMAFDEADDETYTDIGI